MDSIRTRVRRLLPPILSRLPRFPGKGRITLALDSVLTVSTDPSSYLVVGSLNHGCVLRFDLRGWAQKFAFYYRDMEADYVAAMRRLYRGGVFVDVGSSIGLYVVGLADLVRKQNARIAAFEPVPFNCETQKTNIELNGASDLVDVYPFALGAHDAVLGMQADPRRADNNAFISSSGDIEVPVRRLDDLARGWPPIGLMKIDIEGFEPAMLEGARETIERDRPIIFAEFNRERMAINGFTMDETWRWFTDRNFHFFFLHKHRLVPLSDPGIQENLFIVPDEHRDFAIEALRT